MTLSFHDLQISHDGAVVKRRTDLADTTANIRNGFSVDIGCSVTVTLFFCSFTKGLVIAEYIAGEKYSSVNSF
jgi:hypothetical protein